MLRLILFESAIASPAFDHSFSTMADADVVRQRILASIFNRKSGNDDAYVSHLRIWEDTDDGTEKSRYIILARMSDHNV